MQRIKIFFSTKQIWLLFLFTVLKIWGQTPVIKGLVYNNEHQPLPDVHVFLKKQPDKGTITNDKGYFELKVNPGKHNLVIAYLGYRQQIIKLDTNQDKYLIINLKPQKNELNEVLIEVKETQKTELKKLMGIEKIDLKKIEKLPVLLGEIDVLKAVQLLPGVKATGEGGAGFSVHGGSSDQNLILLDGAQIYHPTHLLGFFSIFSSDVIQNIKLYKSSFPASYGNRLSSVLDVKTRKGNMQNFHWGGGIGLISAQAFAEGPLLKNKASFIVSGRRSYADLYLPYLPYDEIKDAKANFYDLNAKLNIDLNRNNHLQLSAYTGRDLYQPYADFNMNYGNTALSIDFNHRFNNHLTANTRLIYSRYDYEISSHENIDHVDYVFDISLAIESQNFKQNFKWQINRNNQLDTGIDAYYHTIKPGNLKNNISGVENADFPDRHAAEIGLYVQHTTRIMKKLQLSYGLRTSVFERLGKETFYKFNNLGETIDTLYADKNQSVIEFVKWAPRISINWQPDNKHALKLSYDKTYQFLHYLINDATTTPTDLWIPSSINLKPQESDQYSFEFNKLIDHKYILSLGGYYRDLQYVTDYKIGTTLSLSPYIERDLVQGTGHAYGLEFLLKKNTGKLTGSLSYTFSKTERKFEGINEGMWFPAAVDHPHDISLKTTYRLNERMHIAALWTYYTGRAITFPAGSYQINVHDILFFSHRNANRLPDYHRLDISFFLKNKKYKTIGGQKIKRKYESFWNFSIFNVYARDNTYMIRFKYDENTEKIDAYQVTLFKFIPSVTYHFKF